MYKPLKSYYSLNSERLLFRPIVGRDVDLWLPFFDNNSTLHFLGMTSSYFKGLSDVEKCSKWLGRQIEREKNQVYGQLAVIEKSSNKFIGVAGLIYRNEMGIENELEVTYSLLPKYHGKGYGTEAATLFKNFAFNEIGLDSVISIIHQENDASKNVARKNGMSMEFEIPDYMGMPVYVFRA